MTDLRFRQIHLDFHTSQEIPGIGSQFDADEFADTLKRAHVDSVTCFSRCHHGYIYHDTAKFPERRHPGLTCNLLKQQIDACHARDIRVPIYITVQWDLYTAKHHPEWLVLDENGGHPGTRPFDAGFYCRLCLNSPYVDFLEAQTVEVCETLPVDGVFFDIVSSTPCSCPRCVEDMLAERLEPSDAGDRERFADEVLHAFQRRLFRVVRSRHPEATVFFNSGHVGPKHRTMIEAFTHLELESLPSGGWGYMHFPLAQRYGRGLERQTLGMTGKFHTTWGDFHSFKSPAALEFECMHAVALGARCSIGDQLHPTGRICPVTYDLIGDTYAKVEAVEPWCRGAKPLVDIGVMSPEEFSGSGGHSGQPGPAIGATRMLQETFHQFDVIDSQTDLSRYRLLVLPDEIPVDESLAAKLGDYLGNGGSVIATHRSGLHPQGDRFGLDALGVALVGDAEFSPDFIVPVALGKGLPDTGHVIYMRGLHVGVRPGAEVLSTIERPYFNRTYRHFCSHNHTPAEGPADYPGAVRNGRCIYFMHPLFSQYYERAPLWCRKLVTNAIDLLLPEPLVRAMAPSTAIIALNEQPDHGRAVLHILHYVPERRGRQFDTIEDIIPIFDVAVSARVESAVSAVRLVPQDESLPFEIMGSRVCFTVPRVDGYQAVAIEG